MRSNLDNPFLTYQDTVDIDFAVTHQLDFISASYVARPEDILEIRYIITQQQQQQQQHSLSYF
jgi:pyruvate kinase